MTAAITKVRRLRTGNLRVGADTLSADDPYILRVNEQVAKEQMIDLWLAFTPALPIPKVTIREYGGGYGLAEDITFRSLDKARLLWEAVVSWRNLDDVKPVPQTVAGATGAVTDTSTPADWMPVVTRRPVTVSEPLEHAFYEGGYAGTTHSRLNSNATADPPVRSMVCNSAMKPFQANLPMRRKRQSLVSIRWIRPASGSFPGNLLQYEGKLNSINKTFAFRGLSISMISKTALIESIQFTPVKFGDDWMWEINMEILHDPKGHVVTTLDTGYAEKFFTGETLPSGATAASDQELDIRDANGRLQQEPSALNGQGKKGSADSPFFGKWRDQELVDFASIPLLQDLVT